MDSFINVLLADGDVEEHIFFKEAINRTNIIGHKVFSVYDGEQILDFVLKRGTYKNSKELTPDIIILDLDLPQKDGLSVIRELKETESLKNIPIYVLTGSANITHMNTCRQLGCAGYFAKQAKNRKLTNIIEAILEKEASQI